VTSDDDDASRNKYRTSRQRRFEWTVWGLKIWKCEDECAGEVGFVLTSNGAQVNAAEELLLPSPQALIILYKRPGAAKCAIKNLN
jgi:hypothetical protein